MFKSRLLFRLSTLLLVFAMSTASQWSSALSQLARPPANGRMPAFWFAHGSPMLIWPDHLPSGFGSMLAIGGPHGPHAQFLRDFGKLLVSYKPKAIVIFSAHWETRGTIEVTSYDKNPLLYDYYGFPDELYQVKFDSKGSPAVAQRVHDLFAKSNIPSRLVTNGVRGFDHGVFVPFVHMFGAGTDIPVVEVSIDSGLDPQRHIDIGKALDPLRDEGIIILAGGLTIHTFKEPNAWDPSTAPQGFKDFERAVVASIEQTKTGEERNEALKAVTRHPFFRRAHPREEHFVPIYVAAGAGTSSDARVLCDLHGAISIGFGV
eukprot:TRINITY_DN11613_c0_g1_i1.p1 TRINITY_DN11613_c0_g1~~TRINITY_DN11613_c0_g1_i1.p1  ORF type:complete len:318 (-),score=52.01 TRINITY_DN11613_c0_g1_i1:282-1235(-)